MVVFAQRGPASFETTVLSWSPGDRIPISAGRTLQVVRVRDNDADQAPVLVVSGRGLKSVWRRGLIFRRFVRGRGRG
jgi:hypothetical protein